VLDPQLELAKLEKKRADAAQRASTLRAKTALPSYAERTPANVKAEDEAKLGKLDAEVAAAEQAMADMRTLLDGGDA
jgi:valyl-tRNA synthetase